MSWDLRIVVPACNEALRIEPTLHDYCSTFANRALVVVVANGCTDNTIEIVSRLQRRYLNLALVSVGGRIGKGGAVRLGLAGGSEPVVAYVDADGSTAAVELDRLATLQRRTGVSAVIASRWLPGSHVDPVQRLTRRLASRVFNLGSRLLFGLPFTDTQCGAKVLARAALESVLRRLELANFSFDIDLLFQLKRAQCTVLEVPTVWRERAVGTKIHLIRSGVSMLLAMLRLRLMESALAQVPFCDLIARSAVIPVKSRLNLLMLAPSSPDNALRRLALRSAALLRENGHGVAWVECGPGLYQRARVLARYLRFGCNRCDAVVELAGRLPFFIPAFTTKPRILLYSGPDPLTGLYRLLYRRASVVNVGARDAAALARELQMMIRQDLPYQITFAETDGCWTLRINDPKCGTSRTHPSS